LRAEDIAVDEVVVTALGIKREAKALGYAVTQVDGSKLAESTTISPVNALQGRAAGVDIAPSEGGIFGGTKITIRGNSTLKGNNMPIFVVDGVIIDNAVSGGSQWGGVDWGNDLKNLNSDEFESVSVLKGAAATALYGSRALNGAIVYYD
jgi:iron complex outermembrane receptor protein